MIQISLMYKWPCQLPVFLHDGYVEILLGWFLFLIPTCWTSVETPTDKTPLQKPKEASLEPAKWRVGEATSHTVAC